MAAHNGALFIRDQIDSILAEIGPDDELIIVDDASTDGTIAVIRAIPDARLRVVARDQNIGYAATFEEALSLAKGDHVFLADQDDVWPSGRVDVMQRALADHAVVAGNVAILDGPDHLRSPFGAHDWRLSGGQVVHPWATVLGLALSNVPYFGSAMAVRRDFLKLALPFPASARELHDGWLALLGLMAGSMVHVEDRVVRRRVHGGNTTGKPRAPHRILVARILFLRMCVTSWRRVRSAKLVT
ncbi:MAG: glycosyl transferase family 2 [Nocardioides sp.]|nr:glycosyl transferase family 2 [Nocardioides sp.]